MTKPSTIQSYDDIINSFPNKKVVFFKEIKTHLPFMKARAASKEGKIWQNAKRMGLNDSFSTNFYEELESFTKSEIIYVAPASYVAGIASGYCKLRKQLLLTSIPMGRSDDSAKDNIYVFILSKHLHPTIVSRITQVFGRLLTSGSAQSYLARAYRQKRTTYEDFDVCLSNVVRFPDQHISGISLKQCKKLIMTVIIFLVTSCIIMLAEILFWRTGGRNM